MQVAILHHAPTHLGTAVRRATGYEAGLGRPMVGRATMVACRQSATRQGRVRVHTLSNAAIRREDGEGPEGGCGWLRGVAH